jgi:hypothetical protein
MFLYCCSVSHNPLGDLLNKMTLPLVPMLCIETVSGGSASGN